MTYMINNIPSGSITFVYLIVLSLHSKVNY